MRALMRGTNAMSEFIEQLNNSPITYVRDMGKLGWLTIAGQPIDGYEVYSGPTGEIRIFNTWNAAHQWRLEQIREHLYGRVCNCEHVSHFAPAAHDLPEWGDIPRDGHPYMERQMWEQYWHDYIGYVCRQCHRTCLLNNWI